MEIFLAVMLGGILGALMWIGYVLGAILDNVRRMGPP